MLFVVVACLGVAHANCPRPAEDHCGSYFHAAGPDAVSANRPFCPTFSPIIAIPFIASHAHEELLTAAKAENANEELVLQASKLGPKNGLTAVTMWQLAALSFCQAHSTTEK